MSIVFFSCPTRNHTSVTRMPSHGLRSGFSSFEFHQQSGTSPVWKCWISGPGSLESKSSEVTTSLPSPLAPRGLTRLRQISAPPPCTNPPTSQKQESYQCHWTTSICHWQALATVIWNKKIKSTYIAWNAAAWYWHYFEMLLLNCRKLTPIDRSIVADHVNEYRNHGGGGRTVETNACCAGTSPHTPEQT